MSLIWHLAVHLTSCFYFPLDHKLREVGATPVCSLVCFAPSTVPNVWQVPHKHLLLEGIVGWSRTKKKRVLFHSSNFAVSH